MAVRVRFAPSPTGVLHLGGFRTALLNYLFAKKNNGTFILRIEDTDQTRTIPGAAEKIEHDLKWLGLVPDESPLQGGDYGPYMQSQRTHLYQEHIPTLIEKGTAYECFCSERRLDLLRREAVRSNGKPGYDNKCRELTRKEVVQKKVAGEKHVIRFKLSLQPEEFTDMLGEKVSVLDLTDPVLMKSDGFPTYHYANIVDDHLMKISHVFRGKEWLISTGLHKQLYRAFGWSPPVFGHLPVLLNMDGTKLSKRQANASIDSYIEQGCSPTLLANFVTRFGGGFSYGLDKLYSLDELVKDFRIEELKSSNTKLDFNFLQELKKVDLRNTIEVNSKSLLEHLKQTYPDADDAYLQRILDWAKPRITSIKELTDMSFLWSQPQNVDLVTSAESFNLLLNEGFSNINGFIKKHNLNKKKFLRDLRMILTGLPAGTPIGELFTLLGEEEVRSRISNFVQQKDRNVARSN